MTPKSEQKGIVILALLAIIVIIISASLIASVSINRQRLKQKSVNVSSLVVSKNALLGYALSQTPPGILPCPDSDNDGYANMSGVNCIAQLGRLPYKTLGIPQQQDATGENLWYALELNYSNTSASPTLNSSTPSTVILNGIERLAAIVIAPGSPIGSQVRGNNNVSNFLEGVNSNGNTKTYARALSDTNNDELVGINTTEFWSTIETYVLGQTKQVLITYYNTPGCGQFPWAATASPYNSLANTQLGFLPWGSTTSPSGSPSCPSSLAAPSWLKTHWASQLRYGFCGASATHCLGIAGDANTSANALVIAPGTPLTGQSRPSTNLNNYFEGDNNDSDLQFEYRKLIHFGNTFNDSLQIIRP